MTGTAFPPVIPDLSDEQSDAVERIVSHFSDGDPDEVASRELSLGGLAGTGKTVTLSWLHKHLPERTCHVPQFVAPTGKAAYVLRQKGVSGAKTIHGTIYDFAGEEFDENDRKTLRFENRAEIDNKPTMFICDEASMVNTELARDLRSHGLPILWVGDYGQLQPVGEDPRIMEAPDIVLKTIHRQALESPIVRLAHAVRNGTDPREYDTVDEHTESGLIVLGRKDFSTVERVVRYCEEWSVDQVLVGFNTYRDTLNRAFRIAKGFDWPIHPGDKLICVLNNRRRQLFNGMTMTVDDVLGAGPEDSVVCNLSTEYKKWPAVNVWLGGLGRSNWRSDEKPEGADVFDYGYAITTHKSQGSEWPRVLVVDQCHPTWDVKRWRYTAYTRAKDHLTVLV